MPTYDLSVCAQLSGFAMLFFSEANKIATVVAGSTAGEEETVKNFTMAAPTDKFSQIVLNGNHAELKKDPIGEPAIKAETSILFTGNQISNNTNDGIVFLKKLAKNCGLAVVAFLNSGGAVYVGPNGVLDADKSFMGDTPVLFGGETGTTGAAITDNQTTQYTLKRAAEPTERIYRPLAPSLVANFITNFV